MIFEAAVVLFVYQIYIAYYATKYLKCVEMEPGQTVRWPLYCLIWAVTFSFILSGSVGLICMATTVKMPTLLILYKAVESVVMYSLVIALLRNLWELNVLTLQLVKKLQRTKLKSPSGRMST